MGSSDTKARELKYAKAKIPYTLGAVCGYGKNGIARKHTRELPYVWVWHTICHAAAYRCGYGKQNYLVNLKY